MIQKRIAFLFLLLLGITATYAQKNCAVAVDEIDPFDSLRTVASETVALGYMIPSKYEEVDGPKIIEEAEVIVLYNENDSISGFFFNLVVPEYKLQPIQQGMNVKFLLADSTVIGLYNFPDEGEFDRSINMRVYQHTCALPLDYFYRIAYHKVMQIRIEYEKKNRTFILSEEQQLALQKSIQCLGKAVGLYPIKS